MNRFTTLINNQLYVTAFSLIGQVFIFITFPLLIKYVGDEDFGIFSLGSAIGGYLSLFVSSFRSSIVKFVSNADGKNDYYAINSIFNTGIIVYFFFGLILSLLNILIANFCLGFFNISNDAIWKAETIFYLNAAFSIIMIPSSIASSFLYSMQKHYIASILQIITTFLICSSILLLIYIKGNIVTLFIIQSMITIIINFITFLIIIKKYKYLKIKSKFFSYSYFKKMTHFGGWIFISALAMVLIYQTDQIIIGLFLPVGMITFYQIGSKLHNFVRMINGLINSPIIPSISNAQSAQDNEYINKIKVAGLRILLAILLPLITSLIVFANPIITIWMGEYYANKATVLSQLFLSYWYIYIIIFYFNNISWGMGLVKKYSKLNLIGAVLNVAISIVLVKTLGIVGVVLGTVCQFIFLSPFYLLYYRNKLSLPFFKLFKEIITPIYGINFSIGITTYLLIRYFKIESWMTLILTFLSVIIVCYVAELLTFNKNEKRKLYEFLRSYFFKLKIRFT